MKKNDPNQPTKHHIDPRSRIKGVAVVPRATHENYHKLFGNLRPEEIVEYLNKTFWNNNYTITIRK